MHGVCRVFGAGWVVVSLAGSAAASILFNNGPLITNPTGGTGSIAGQPISQADPFTIPGQSFIFSTTGVGATVAASTAIADNFTVPVGQTWDLSAATFFAYQTGQAGPAVTSIRVNLWKSAPYSAGSPGPLPDPLPQQELSQPLILAAGAGVFVCHRQSSSGTATNRPVFAYTVSLDGLPNGGLLDAGTYWLQWSFEGVGTGTVFTPLVTPREAAFDLNARQFAALDGNLASPREWFEGREGFVSGVTEGRPYALPFVLSGSTIPGPTCGGALAIGVLLAFRRRRALA